jgi:signal transduction histidine kinase/ActR/RegA family two-component response regulator
MEALRTGTGYVSKKPFSDEFGTFMTAVAPVFDSSGRPVALVGVDLFVEDFVERLAHVNRSAAISVGFIFAASLIIGLLVYFNRRKIVVQEVENLRAEADKAALIERDQRLVSALGQIVYHFDVATRRITWRGDSKSILGLDADKMPDSPEALAAVIRSGDSSTISNWPELPGLKDDVLLKELRIDHPDGRTIWMLDRAVVVNDSAGSPVAVDGVLLDITRQKNIELELIAARDRAEAAGRAKSDFLAVMSHEIRTPMNGVIGCTNLLLESGVTEQQREYLETVRKCGDSLLSLINDVLDFSKMESDKLTLETRPFSLRECVGEVIDLYSIMAAEKSIELLAYFEDSGLDGIVGDEVRVRQILVNLIGNAIKFTRDGEVMVTLGTRSWLPEGRAVMISVKDTGIGISKEQQQNIFQPFSQADSSTTRKFGGTGLGLAICGRLASLMGGAITVHSEPGRGSEFVVLFPLTPGEELTPAPGLAVPHDLQSLFICRQGGLRQVVRAELAPAGIGLRFADEPDPALLQHSPPFDFVFIEDMASGEAITAFLKEAARFPTTKIILLRGPSLPGIPAQNDSRFAVEITKPLRPGALRRLIGGLLSPAGPEVPVTAPVTRDLLALRHPLRILIAEDNATNRKVVSHMLNRLGYQPAMVENGRLCVERLDKEEYDMILMDVQMPEMDGYEATSVIRNQGRKIWITALTADAMPEDPLRCQIAGMNDYLSKPVRPAELENAILRCALSLKK